MQKLIFTGCSFTAGNGWIDVENSNQIECKHYPGLWTNLCHSQIPQLARLHMINGGQGGASNTEIFQNTVNYIAQHGTTIDTIFCQWTIMPRYSFTVGFELWDTSDRLERGGRSKHDITLSNGDKWNRKYLDDLLDRLLVLHHLHGEILKVVGYSNILKKLVKNFDIKLYFINGLCPWDQDYFVRLNKALPEDYTPFTKKHILDIESKNDNDILQLYNIMHDDYDRAGGIDPHDWVNLYSSMKSDQTDTNYDNTHPGITSNQHYYQQVLNFLQDL